MVDYTRTPKKTQSLTLTQAKAYEKAYDKVYGAVYQTESTHMCVLESMCAYLGSIYAWSKASNVVIQSLWSEGMLGVGIHL